MKYILTVSFTLCVRLENNIAPPPPPAYLLAGFKLYTQIQQTKYFKIKICSEQGLKSLDLNR